MDLSFLDADDGVSKPEEVSGVPVGEDVGCVRSLALPEVSMTPEEVSRKFAHGTTTLSFVYSKGIVVAVDSRSTMGNYVASGSVKKTLVINSHILGTMAGGAADCAFWERELACRCRLWELRNGTKLRPTHITVAAASKLLSNTLYAYRGAGFSVGTMIAGWDITKKSPEIYYVDSEGTRLRGNLFSVGSGSTYALGVLDANWRWDMNVEEATELGRRAIYHATHRDAYSGGIINVFAIDQDGWRKVSSDDTFALHYDKYGTKDVNSLVPSPDSLLPN